MTRCFARHMIAPTPPGLSESSSCLRRCIQAATAAGGALSPPALALFPVAPLPVEFREGVRLGTRKDLWMGGGCERGISGTLINASNMALSKSGDGAQLEPVLESSTLAGSQAPSSARAAEMTADCCSW
ncbi:hypothetical protein B0H12DRAFT_1233725 [Mycena haematopus]|nr:hypothetical protein B0H12DRAFT_1233725 [Mycena haematopus]